MQFFTIGLTVKHSLFEWFKKVTHFLLIGSPYILNELILHRIWAIFFIVWSCVLIEFLPRIRKYSVVWHWSLHILSKIVTFKSYWPCSKNAMELSPRIHIKPLSLALRSAHSSLKQYYFMWVLSRYRTHLNILGKTTKCLLPSCSSIWRIHDHLQVHFTLFLSALWILQIKDKKIHSMNK